MNPTQIAGATNLLGAPKGWNEERDGKCGALAVKVLGAHDTMRCLSAWQPTAEELQLIRGGHVILTVCGWQVPVSLHVELPSGQVDQVPADH